MRAVTVRAFADLDQVSIEDRPDPQPGPHELVVEVKAVAVNYVDLVTLRGEYQFVPSLPYVPGKGPAGIVRSLGTDVEGLAPGDRVLAMAEYGGYAELVAVDQRSVYRLPPVISFEDAAAMALAYDTAWMALRDRARFSPGESVLVLGASGAVGQACVQLARAMGAGAVLAAASRPERVVHLGADGIIDLSSQSLRDAIREQVRSYTGGAGVDIVIDPVGGDAFDGAVRSLAWKGRLVVVGFASGRIPTLKVNYALLKNIEISGLQISDYRKRTPELVAECFREVFHMTGAGQVTPPARTVFPLDEWRTAVEQLSTRSGRDRLLLRP